MKPIRDILEGPFAPWLGDSDWTPWYSFLMALRGEAMTETERRIFRRCTGRTTMPSTPFGEAWVVVGRRGRKSAIAAVLATYLALYGQWPRAQGETVRVLVVAVSKDQAKLIRSYAEAILASRPAFQRRIKATDAESITLTNGIAIQCVANSFRSIRGPTVVCAIFEEVAFWYSDDSANPDKEVLRAVRPSMLTVPGSLLLGISSPYAKRGLLYERHRAHFGRDGSRVLVWQANTQVMNPGVDREVIAQAYRDDPVAAAAEYGAEFRNDLEAFISREALDAVVARGVRERAPLRDTSYVGFVDPSGGSADAMTLAIAHRDADVAVLDCLREVRPPFSPESVVGEFADTLAQYRVKFVTGDRYAGEWPREQFRKRGIEYRPAARTKSELYIELLPPVNSGRVDLLDDDRLTNQLVGLERRTARSGRDSIDHPPGAHDDLANAVAGAVHLALSVARHAGPTEFGAPIVVGDRPRPTWLI